MINVPREWVTVGMKKFNDDRTVCDIVIGDARTGRWVWHGIACHPSEKVWLWPDASKNADPLWMLSPELVSILRKCAEDGLQPAPAFV